MRYIVLFNVLLFCVSTPGQSINVISLGDTSRFLDFSNNSGFSEVRSDLLNPSLFSPNGTVPVSINLLPSVPTFDTATTSRADVLMLHNGHLLSSIERDFLDGWVGNGGRLFLFGDQASNLATTFGASIGALSNTGLGVAVVGNSSPLTSGPFGSLPLGPSFNTQFHGGISQLGPNSSAVFRTSNGAGQVFGGTITHGKGQVVFFGDEEIFLSSSPGSPAAPVLSTNSRVAFRNSLAHLATYQPPTSQRYADFLGGHSPSLSVAPPTAVLGIPDGAVADFDNIGNAPGYFEVAFNSPLVDGMGDDIVVHLIDWIRSENESFDLYASQDGSDFRFVGSSREPNDSTAVSFDLYTTGLPEVNYLRIENGRVDNGGAFEGPDIDAIEYRYRSPSTQPPTTADFNGDGWFDCFDVDALSAEIASGNNAVSFDLTGDGVVNLEDRDSWLVDASLASPFLGRFYPGDANLDGAVDVSDLNIYNQNKYTANPSFCSGDFNADGVVDVSDLNIWNNQKFRPSLATVPEPGDPLLTLFGFAAIATLYRRRKLQKRITCLAFAALITASLGQANGQTFGTVFPDHVPGTAGDGIPDLFYNPNNGIVTLDTDGQSLFTVKFESPAISSYLDGSPSGPAIFPTEEHRGPQGFYQGPGGEFRFWDSTYVEQNGTSQWTLFTDSSNTGINGRFDIAQYPPDLSVGPSGSFGYSEFGQYSQEFGAETWFSHLSAGQTTWLGSSSNNWHDPANWDRGVPNRNVDAVIDDAFGFVEVHSPAEAKSVQVNNATLTLASGSDVQVSDVIVQQSADLQLRDDATLHVPRVDLSVGASNNLVVSGNSTLVAERSIRLPNQGSSISARSMSVSESGFVRTPNLVGGLRDIGNTSLAISDEASVDIDHMHVGNLRQFDGGVLYVRESARIDRTHFLSMGGRVELSPGASYSAKDIDFVGPDGFASVRLTDRTSFSVDGNQVNELNDNLVAGKIARNGSTLGLIATLDTSGNTQVVYAPSLGGDIDLDGTGFNDLEFHNSVGNDPQRKNLVTMVHGWRSSPDTWQRADRDIVGAIVNEVDGSDWHVATYDWEENAATWINSSLLPISPPSASTKAHAYAHGSHLASQILDGNYKDVHLIAHSLGGRVIDTASRVLKQEGWDGTIHLTFLDGYTPHGWESFFGSEATWADHYIHSGAAVDTQGEFPFARNVDLTELQDILSVNLAASHEYPITWYYNSIINPQSWLTASDGILPYGFHMSQEAGFGRWPNGMPAYGTDQLTTTLVAQAHQPQLWAQRHLSSHDVFLLTHGDETVFGTVEVIEGALSLLIDGSNPAPGSMESALTKSKDAEPVWANSSLLIDDVANTVSFDFEFPLDGAGLLTAFVNGTEIWASLELLAYGEGSNYSGLITLDGDLPAGMHSLGFRLDSLDGNSTQVLISDIQTSFLFVVPESDTSTLLVIALAPLLHSTLRRRRSRHLRAL